MTTYDPTTEPNVDLDITVSMSPDLGMQMIEAVGGFRDGRGRYVFPDDHAAVTFWVLSEAVEYALRAMPTIVFDAL